MRGRPKRMNTMETMGINPVFTDFSTQFFEIIRTILNSESPTEDEEKESTFQKFNPLFYYPKQLFNNVRVFQSLQKATNDY